MTFSKIKLLGLLTLSCSLIACGQTQVSTVPNAAPSAAPNAAPSEIAQPTVAAQPTESPVTAEKSPEPQSSALESTKVDAPIAQSQNDSTKVDAPIVRSQDSSTQTTAAQQTKEPVYSGMKHVQALSIYINEKQDLGDNRWRFRTKAQYSRGKDYYSPWRTADCGKSSIDGKIIPAIDTSSAEEGEAKVVSAICRLPK